ncbi:AAA family ATPase [Paraburkholderia madseniana]|uniref:ATP-dependent nuclease n=1 Tax=Paraburkholderia madseniana TaxID=2599607 RepID=UPI0015C52C11|nr:AAA family ATPase [Paraburkholderia madseniana]NPT64582.1 AAA family ATPase [Paraburkholderia madseniana]
MHISKITIRNFKCFRDTFVLALNRGMNILVGDNDSGKSTILEAINLTLSGVFHGRFLRNDLSEHVFNREAVEAYVADPKIGLPDLLIELFFGGEGVDEYKGNGNSLKDQDAAGIKFSVHFDEQYRDEYAELLKSGVTGLPIEYYEIVVESFARKVLTTRGISLSAAFIDSSGVRYQNGSDAYVSRIVRDFLGDKERVALAKVHREMADAFRQNGEVGEVNRKINEANDLLDGREISLAVDLAARSAWESNLITCIDRIPFHFIGKGEQSLAKIAIALAHKRASSANVLLVEEPENHLSHSRLNQLIDMMAAANEEKQIIMTTHSSFVANKANLSHLIMLNDGKTTRLSELNPETSTFFQKLAGYDTLRLLLCKRAILVEGDSDELVVQKAYKLRYGKLPIECGVDVISVGTSFLRFLEIAEKLKKPVAVVTDNDGNVDALKKKYESYLGGNAKNHIRICFDEAIDARKEIAGESFNFNTLEPRMLAANGCDTMNELLGTAFDAEGKIMKHMRANKTDCALKIFTSDKDVKFPDYVTAAIEE